MSEETTAQEDVAGILTEALLKAKEATAVMCALCLNDGTALSFASGPFVSKAGLVKVMEGLVRKWSLETERVEEDEEDV